MSAYQIMEENNGMLGHVGEKFKAKLMTLHLETLSYINESLWKYGTISKI